jgi:lipopolysaccharide export system permease protein
VLTTLDRYVLKKLIRMYLPVILGLGALFFIASLLRMLKAEDLSVGQIILAVPWLLPFLLPYLIPLSYAITVALVLGRLVADQEVLAFVSLGIPQRSIGWPAVLLAVPLSLTSLWIGAAVVPYSYQRTKEAVRAVFESLLTLGEGEHLSRVFDKEGFDIYVRKYGKDGLQGIVIHYDVRDYASDTDSTQPVQVVAERGGIAPGSISERIVLRLEDVTATIQARGAERNTTRPVRAHLSRYDQAIGLSGRRRIKPNDFATSDLRELAARATDRTALACATGGLLACRQASDPRGLDARIELTMRSAVALGPLVLALLVAPLTLLIGGRSPLVPLVVGLVAACLLYFAPLILGRSLADKYDAPGLVFLGCATALAGAAAIAWLASRGAPGSGEQLVSKPVELLGRLRSRLVAWLVRAPRAEVAAPAPTGRARGLLSRLGDPFAAVPLLDRWIGLRLVKAWLAFAFVVLLVFLVLDAFTNLDDLTKGGWPAFERRYGLALPELFLSACPFVTLGAGLWVVVQLRRNAELAALLAAGIDPRRLLVPFLALAVGLAPLVWADREHVLPRLGYLRRERKGRQTFERPRPVPVNRSDGDGGGVLAPRFLLSGTGELKDVRYTELDDRFRERRSILAATGHAAPDGWLLEQGWLIERTEGPGGALVETVAPIASGGVLVRTRTNLADVEAAVEAQAYLSAKQLRDQLRRTPGFKHLAMQLHERATYPLAAFVLLLLAVPIALGGGPGAVDAFMRVLVGLSLSGVYFLLTSLCYELGSRDALPPAVAAWLPVALFGGVGLYRLVRPPGA